MALRVVAEKLATAGCALLLVCVLTSAQISNPSSAVSKTSPSKTASTATRKTRKARKSASRHSRGQQKIDPKRAHEIQEALIREHYLEGKPTGVWNDATQKAMQRYQADNR